MFIISCFLCFLGSLIVASVIPTTPEPIAFLGLLFVWISGYVLGFDIWKLFK